MQGGINTKEGDKSQSKQDDEERSEAKEGKLGNYTMVIISMPHTCVKYPPWLFVQAPRWD